MGPRRRERPSVRYAVASPKDRHRRPAPRRQRPSVEHPLMPPHGIAWYPFGQNVAEKIHASHTVGGRAQVDRGEWRVVGASAVRRPRPDRSHARASGPASTKSSWVGSAWSLRSATSAQCADSSTPTNRRSSRRAATPMDRLPQYVHLVLGHSASVHRGSEPVRVSARLTPKDIESVGRTAGRNLSPATAIDAEAWIDEAGRIVHVRQEILGTAALGMHLGLARATEIRPAGGPRPAGRSRRRPLLGRTQSRHTVRDRTTATHGGTDQPQRALTGRTGTRLGSRRHDSSDV